MSLTVKTLKIAPDLLGRIEAHGAAHGLRGFSAAALDLIQRGLDPAGSAVLDTLTPGPLTKAATERARAAPIRAAKAKGKAPRVKVSPPDAAPPPLPSFRCDGGVRVAPTQSTPAAGAARVRDIDLPVGRDRPAYGSMMKGGGKARR